MRAWSYWRDVLIVVKPATVVHWQRSAFRRVWTWRSRRAPGRPPIDRRTRDLVRQLAQANLLWGAPRIHGELLKLGIGISEREVSRLMPRAPRKPPSQTWRTFLSCGQRAAEKADIAEHTRHEAESRANEALYLGDLIAMRTPRA